jgi:hypothetical protein
LQPLSTIVTQSPSFMPLLKLLLHLL